MHAVFWKSFIYFQLSSQAAVRRTRPEALNQPVPARWKKWLYNQHRIVRAFLKQIPERKVLMSTNYATFALEWTLPQKWSPPIRIRFWIIYGRINKRESYSIYIYTLWNISHTITHTTNVACWKARTGWSGNQDWSNAHSPILLQLWWRQVW